MPVEPQPDGEIIAAGGLENYIRKLARAIGSPDTMAGVTSKMAVTGSNLILSDIPTADPAVLGAVWNSSGTLKISAGP